MNNQLLSSKVPPISKFIPGIAWFFLVLILVCIPGDKLPKVDNWLIEFKYDKLIHVGLFAVLAYLFIHPITKSTLVLKVKWHYVIKIVIATAMWGLTTEIIQKFYIPGRSFDLADWAADSLGGLFALLYYKICLRREIHIPTQNKT